MTLATTDQAEFIKQCLEMKYIRCPNCHGGKIINEDGVWGDNEFHEIRGFIVCTECHKHFAIQYRAVNIIPLAGEPPTGQLTSVLEELDDWTRMLRPIANFLGGVGGTGAIREVLEMIRRRADTRLRIRKSEAGPGWPVLGKLSSDVPDKSIRKCSP